ncbi:MAG: glycosyltransferase family 9 protein [Planctomycetota bacterium]|nr:MAG: glycosyltransferase family 9 protein [Planctomycetota bacterium]
MSALPRSVLVVRLGAIGDVANALVVAAGLKRADPSIRVGWAVHPLAEPLVRANPAVDRVHVWNKAGGAGAFRALVRELRAERYELAIDAQRIFKSALVARWSRAPRVLGYDRARCKEQSWLLTRERVAARPAAPSAGAPARHMVEQYADLLEHLGLPRAPLEHPLPRSSEAAAWADAQLARCGAPPILVNVGASKPANRWRPERFAELALALAARAPVCVTGGAADRELARAALERLRGAPNVHDLVGATSLVQYVELARRARLYVGCDTGPMHVAAAAGCRCVALFGPADPARTGPWPAAAHEVLRVPPPCAPCGLKHCNQPRHACMDDLAVELVRDAVLRRM